MSRAIDGRVADESDVHPDGAIFYVPDGRSTVYSFGRDLPISVKIVKPDDGDDFPKPGSVVQILQAEQTDDGTVILGFMHEGSDCVCTLEDVQVLQTE